MADEAIFELIPDAGERLVARMTSGPWAHDSPRHLRWTAREIAAHVATIIGYFDAMLEGGSPVPSLHALTAANAADLDRRTHTEWSTIVDEVRTGVERVSGALRSRPRDEPLRWHGQLPISTRAAAGVFAGELLIHDWDLARTLRQPPSLTADDARCVLAEVREVMPHVLDRAAAGRRVHLRLRVRGGDRFDLRVADQQMTIGPPAGRPDCTVSADPIAFLLVAYKRRGLTRVVATGGAAAWGRKPWQALSLPRLLDVP